MKKVEDLTVVIAAKTHGMAQLIRMSLRGVGVRAVHIAQTPKQTVEAFQTCQPDVLITVVENAENDEGLSLIRFIRRWDKSPNPRIPIVAASQRAELAVVSAVINNGGNEFVVLPASADQLMKKVLSAVQSNRPFVDTPDYVGPERRRRADPNYAGPERRVAVAGPAPEEAAPAEEAPAPQVAVVEPTS
ncbi:MAG: response regulator [Alphaproteobacteria bacterium]